MKNPLLSRNREEANRVLRGGCWNLNALYVRVARRDNDDPSSTVYDLGFRIFRTQEKS